MRSRCSWSAARGPGGSSRFAGASGLVVLCNLLRIGLSIWVGVLTGSPGLVLFHDWVGTAFGIIYILMGFMVFLAILLPSNRQLVKEMNRAH